VFIVDKMARNAEETAFQTEVERHFRWNFAVNVLEGACFWFGITFAAPATIMPLYVSHLTNSRVLIGLISTITGAGWYLPQLLTANYVEQLPVKKRMVINVGFFSERLPFLFMAVSAFVLATNSPALALTAFFFTLIWLMLGAGAIAVAWQEMVAKVIPVTHRGRLLGIANFGGTAMGILGAALSAAILARYPFPTSFGFCFALAFVFIMLSWLFLALTREPPLCSYKPTISVGEYWRCLPLVLHRDSNFASYLLTRVMTMLGRMGVGFVTVYAVERWQLSDSQAGLYTTVILVGQAIANLAFGALADRRGHKLVLEISLSLSAICMLGALLAPTPGWMYVVFAGIGALTASDILSSIGIVMEFTGPDDRPTYLGLANTIPGLFAAIAPMIGGWIASRIGYGAVFLMATLPSFTAWAILHWMVREPRNSAAYS